jgi:membrane-associated phospholipid phosphatase
VKLRLYERFRLLTAATLLVVIAVVHYVDRTLAQAAAGLQLFRSALTSAPVGLPIMIALAIIGVATGAAYLLARRPMPRWAAAAMLAGLALAWSVCLVEFVLKPVFGRVVPTIFLSGGPYGFFWFHRGTIFGSFPSGHSDQAAAILSVLWVYYPAWRWAYLAAFALLACALIIGEWHFLGDILAGGYIGTVSGLLITRIWNVVRPDTAQA